MRLPPSLFLLSSFSLVNFLPVSSHIPPIYENKSPEGLRYTMNVIMAEFCVASGAWVGGINAQPAY